MSELIYLYGFGNKKHIADPDSVPDRWGERQALCNAWGFPEQIWHAKHGPEVRPMCKRCEKKAEAQS